DMVVVGEADRGRGAADAVTAAGGADVVVLDVSMPDITGSQVALELHAMLPETKIVALTRHAEKAYVQQMLQNGANGYVLKQTSADVLIAAIRTVNVGGTYLDPAVAGKIVETGARPMRGAGSDELTVREREVVTMVAYGHTNKEIAAVLGITVKTVETHKTNAMQKLEITSRADLVRFAIAQGWLATRGQ
ncbi:MAG TPA: response regulator transcription factor, partial [Thermoanaerobaculia bacterium]